MSATNSITWVSFGVMSRLTFSLQCCTRSARRGVSAPQCRVSALTGRAVITDQGLRRPGARQQLWPRMFRLIQAYLAATGQPDLADRAPARFHNVGALNAFGPQFGHFTLEISAHQV